MTTRAAQTTTPTRPTAPHPGVGRRILVGAAVAATLPYLSLKAAWVAGSHLGIPEGSILLKPGLFFTAANAMTLAMDACVILLVLLLTRPWGMRVPSWLLTVPVFVATGLLTPIVLGFPSQLLVKALGMGADERVRAASKPFLESWVFVVVYSGFIIQAVALAGLFVPYARKRWGGLWQGAAGRRLPSPTGVVAGAAAVCAAAVGAVYLYWAFGGSAGLSAQQAAVYSAETGVVSAADAVCAFGAAAGALLLARGGTGRADLRLALAWIGAGATFSWGAWMLLSAVGPQLDSGDGPTLAATLTYAGQMITGLLSAGVLIRFLRSRRTA
ncbi:hypothetical protein ABZW32_10770 [Streptomyces sp. NPDC004667]|uniref:hypothetical protein n=1 Tax=Streptomyces sp. NPDC004667 TaxID=3154285 RepID=UPI0033AB6F29